MNAMMSKVTTIAIRNGQSGSTSLSIGRSLIAMPTNRQSPTGGVMLADRRGDDADQAEMDGMDIERLRHRQQHRHGERG